MALTETDAPLVSASTVVEVLGGLDGVQRITGCARNSVHNWIAADQFPARYFFVMHSALRRRRLRAVPQLWGQVCNEEAA